MEKLALLDCGGQYTKVIDRKVRELGVCCDIFPIGVKPEKLSGYGAVILSGGPSSVYSDKAPEFDAGIFSLNVPMLGICYGMQLICEYFGGRVLSGVRTEYGQTEINIDVACPMFEGLSSREKVLMSHGDAVSEMPEGFVKVADTGGVIAGVYSAKRRMIGVQFHPEVDPTVNGRKMLENFLRKVACFKETYALADRIQTSVDMIRSRVKDKKVLVLVSGGVDSAVTAALLVRALPPENVYAIHIDHGMMRKNESDIICKGLSALGLVNMLRVNAEEEFFNGTVTDENGVVLPPLSQTTEPEMKRKIIGEMFIRVTKEASEQLGIDFDSAFLAQGTLRPDLIESGNPDVSGYANKIKTHHNDVGIIRQARERGKIIETNWDWHKDEVREVARRLGLPEEVASRQPFPGPGLGVRILCSDGTKTADKETQAAPDAYASGNITLTAAPVASVGVQGDNRSYKNLCVMSGENPGWEALINFSRTIPNNIPGVNRTAFLISKKELSGELYSRELYINHASASLLREIDAIVTEEIMNPKISQCLSVLLPITCGDGYGVAIRAVVTSDFMTARAAVPGVDFPAEALPNITRRLSALPRVDLVLYDTTGKPPATVEWE